MAKKVLLVSSSISLNSSTANTTQYWYAYGSSGLFPATDEATGQIICRSSGTYSLFSISFISNSVNASTVFTVRKDTGSGAANTSLSISVPSSTSGNRQLADTSVTATFAAGDKMSVESKPGAGSTGTFTFATSGLAFKADSTDTVTRLTYVDQITYQTNATTFYSPIGGSSSNSSTTAQTESFTKCRQRRAGTFKNVSMRVITNSRDVATTYHSRKNGANGNITFDVPANQTGWFEETTLSDSVAAGDDWNHSITLGGSSGSAFLVETTTCEFITTDGYFQMVTAYPGGSTFPDAGTRYLGIGGDLDLQATSNSIDEYASDQYRFSDLTALVTANDVTSASTVTLMKGGVATAVVASVTASQTGVFSDTTHTVDTVSTDLLNTKIVVPSISGNHGINIRVQSLWGLSLVVDSTRVTNANTLKYNLIGRITHTDTLKYNIIGRILHSNTLKYNLRKQILHSNTLKYNLRKQILHSNTLRYNLIGRIVHSQTLKYHLLKQILHANTLRYNVWKQVKKADTLLYNLRKQVTKQNTILYNVAAGALSRILHANTLNYNVRLQVKHSNSLRYNLLKQILHNQTLKYNVWKQIKHANTIRYNLIGRIVHANTLRYNIIGRIIHANTLRYNLVGRIVHSQTLKYSLIGRIKHALTLKYNLLTFVRSLISYDDFEAGTYSFTQGGNSPNNKWTNDYLGGIGATSGVRYSASAGSNVMYEKPQASTSAGETHATLNLSAADWYDFDLTFKQKTISQLRTGSAPNAWECAWIIFRYTDDWHHYYFILKTSGIELGRKDYFPHVEQQMFLFTDSGTTLTIGNWDTIRIKAVGNHFTIWVDGVQKIDMIDDGTVGFDSQTSGLPPAPTAAMYHGKLGPYTEDAEVEFDSFATTPTIRYNLLKQVTKANTLLWNLIATLARITNARTLKYNLIQRQIHTNTLKYNIAQQIKHSNTLRYNLLKQILHANTIRYNIIGRIIHSNTLKYNLLKQIKHSNTLRYGLIGRILHSQTLKYNLLKQTLHSNTIRYNLIGRILHSQTLKYNLLKQALHSNTLKYNLRKQILHSNTLVYNLRKQVLHSNILKYNLLKQITHANILKYNLLGRITHANILKYNLLGRIVHANTLVYNILSLVRHIELTITEANIKLSDNFYKSRTITEDNINLGDSVSAEKTDNTPIATEKTINESNIALGSGTLSRVVRKVRQLTDNITLGADSASITRRNKVRTLTDTINMGDSLSLEKSQRHIEKSLSDSISLGDSVSRQTNKSRRIGGPD